jgi:hypothetical protein
MNGSMTDFKKILAEESIKITSEFLNRLMREHKVIPVKVIREYWLADEERKKVLIDIYGEEAFMYSPDDMDILMFFAVMYSRSGKTIYPVSHNGKTINIQLLIEDVNAPTVEVVSDGKSNWHQIKDWFSKKQK